MKRNYYVYILANKYNTVLYTGYTNNIQRRILEHKKGINVNSFSYKYFIKELLYFEIHFSKRSAKHREYLIKKWKVKWKLELISKNNPHLIDLAKDGVITDEVYTKLQDSIG